MCWLRSRSRGFVAVSGGEYAADAISVVQFQCAIDPVTFACQANVHDGKGRLLRSGQLQRLVDRACDASNFDACIAQRHFDIGRDEEIVFDDKHTGRSAGRHARARGIVAREYENRTKA